MQLQDVFQGFKKHFHSDPSAVVTAPGRVNLIGEHTDYSDGFVLPVAINFSISIAFSPLEKRMVRLYSVDFDEIIEIDLATLAKSGAGWQEYVKGVAWALQDAGFTLNGWQGVISGNIPIGAGLSSSAAFEVATTRVFSEIGHYDLSPTATALIGRKAETGWVGVQVGIMDQLISAAGKEHHAVKLDCRSLDYEYIPMPENVQMMVLDTNTRRQLTQSSYNDRQSEVKAAAKLLQVPALRDATLSLLDQKRSLLTPTLYRRAKHVISENERVHAFSEAMQNNDLNEMGTLLNASHNSLKNDFEVSSPELNLIVELAQSRPICIGARMTGAGFGGCALALVQDGDLPAFTEFIEYAYEKETGLKPGLYSVKSADGVKTHTIAQ